LAAIKRSWRMPGEKDLGLLRIENQAGLSVSRLSNGCVFAIEHRCENTTVMINQILGSPLDGGIGRIFLRASSDATPLCTEIIGPCANV